MTDLVGLSLEDANAPRPPWIESPSLLLCAGAGHVDAVVRWCPYLVGDEMAMSGLRCALVAAVFSRAEVGAAAFLRQTGYEVANAADGGFELDLRAMWKTAYLDIAPAVDLSDHGVLAGLAPRSVNPRTARRAAIEDASWRIATASVRFPIGGHVETVARGERLGPLPFRGEGAIEVGPASIERLSFVATAAGNALAEIGGPSRLSVTLSQHHHDLRWTFRELQLD